MGKKQIPDFLVEYYKEKLSTDRSWVEQAILRLYSYQTDQEKTAGETHEFNDVGFSGADARKLSYFARWLQSGKPLSGEYLEEAFDRTPKYAKQLIAISDPAVVERIIKKLETKNGG